MTLYLCPSDAQHWPSSVFLILPHEYYIYVLYVNIRQRATKIRICIMICYFHYRRDVVFFLTWKCTCIYLYWHEQNLLTSQASQLLKTLWEMVNMHVIKQKKTWHLTFFAKRFMYASWCIFRAISRYLFVISGTNWKWQIKISARFFKKSTVWDIKGNSTAKQIAHSPQRNMEE